MLAQTEHSINTSYYFYLQVSKLWLCNSSSLHSCYTMDFGFKLMMSDLEVSFLSTTWYLHINSGWTYVTFHVIPISSASNRGADTDTFSVSSNVSWLSSFDSALSVSLHFELHAAYEGDSRRDILILISHWAYDSCSGASQYITAVYLRLTIAFVHCAVCHIHDQKFDTAVKNLLDIHLQNLRYL
jgi:hypothetical protein